MRSWIFAVLLMCQVAAVTAAQRDHALDQVADAYLTLALQLTHYDKNPFVFIGDKSRLAAAKSEVPSLAELETQLAGQLAVLRALTHGDAGRRASLDARLLATLTRAQILQGKYPASFDDETRLMFGVVVPSRSETHFSALIAELDQLIPGDAPLHERMERFRDQFVIPVEKLSLVMNTALQECRRRTKANIAMPADEALQLVIVQDKPFVGFTQFMGDSRSQILINRDVPVHIERAIELGCHEAYPGHHTHGSLLEANISMSRGWAEFDYFPLYGPFAIVMEGVANFGIDVAFPADEREKYERDILLPMAGISDNDYATYQHYLRLQRELNFARNEAARMYLYGGASREEAIEWLMRFGLETRGTASQRLDFIAAYRTYVICYNFGLDVVEQFVQRTAQNDTWDTLENILNGNITPEMMLQTIQQ